MRLRVAIAVAVVGVVVAVVAIPRTLFAASPAPNAAQPAPAWVPTSLSGLSVQREDIAATVKQDTRSLWVTDVSLYSLRHGKELEATLQVARFTASAPWQSPDFDLSLAGQLGATTPIVARIGGLRVYITSTRGLDLMAWFKNGWMLVLATRTTYTTPKDLVRQALGLTP